MLDLVIYKLFFFAFFFRRHFSFFSSKLWKLVETPSSLPNVHFHEYWICFGWVISFTISENMVSKLGACPRNGRHWSLKLWFHFGRCLFLFFYISCYCFFIVFLIFLQPEGLESCYFRFRSRVTLSCLF